MTGKIKQSGVIFVDDEGRLQFVAGSDESADKSDPDDISDATKARIRRLQQEMKHRDDEDDFTA